MPTSTQFAAATWASRSEFADIFLRAQSDFDIERRTQFEAIAASIPDNKAAFSKAADFAAQNNWLDDLIDQIIDADREDGTLRDYRLTQVAGGAAIQAMTNQVRGMSDPYVVTRGITNAMRWTGKVLIDGQPMGTGVLVLPHIFLTAWHVVHSLFINKNGNWECLPGAAQRIQIGFDDYLFSRRKSIVSPPPLIVGVHNDWCVDFQPCHQKEMAKQIPDDLRELVQCMDFALIQLALPVGLDRNWAILDPRVVTPKFTDIIYVFQHPRGFPQKVDRSQVLAPQLSDDSSGVPHLRFLHDVNTDQGASGGPCFDKQFMLCGIHQGEWRPPVPPAPKLNRGIPIARIWEHVSKKPSWPPSPPPESTYVYNLQDASGVKPIIGCDDFQRDLWQVALAGQGGLIAIYGENGSGKTFRTLVADSILSPANHLKLIVDAPSILARNAQEVATYLCSQQLSVSTISEMNATPSTWLKDELVPKVIEALELARQGSKLVWIVLKNLNKTGTYGENTSDFLYLLYDQIKTRPWLRFILDGMIGDIPESLGQQTTIHRPQPITEIAILQCLEKTLNQLGIAYSPPDLQSHAKAIMKRYKRATLLNANNALATEIGDVVDAYH